MILQNLRKPMQEQAPIPLVRRRIRGKSAEPLHHKSKDEQNRLMFEPSADGLQAVQARSVGRRMVRKTSREDWERQRRGRGREEERSAPEPRERSRTPEEEREAPAASDDDTEALLNEIIEVLLVGNSRSKEVKWSTLPEKVRSLFRVAMEKEWSKWEQFRATIPVNETMLMKLPPEQKVIGTRWVLTYKSNGDAKARLVVQGCQEPAAHIRGDAHSIRLTEGMDAWTV